MTVLPTSLVGSYPQPDWLIDREALGSHVPARVRARELWRVDQRRLREAQDDATLLAIRDQERAGLDIVTDGEIRRESYSNRFATALRGIDLDHPGTTLDRSGHPIPVPRVAGPLAPHAAAEVDDLRFLRAQHRPPRSRSRCPGPFTMTQQAQNDYYEHEEELALAYADVVNEEIADLFAAGADIVQLDEPWMESRAEQARALRAADAQARARRRRPARRRCTSASATRPSSPTSPPAYSFLAELADAPVAQISIETAQSKLDLAVLERAARQDDHPRRHRPRRRTRSRRPRRWPSASAGRCPTSAPTS